jgi:hypothetical protein
MDAHPTAISWVRFPVSNSVFMVLYKNTTCFVDMDVGLLVINSASSSDSFSFTSSNC